MHKRFKIKLAKRVGLLVAVGLLACFAVLFFVRTHGKLNPQVAQADNHSVDGAITVSFGREVASDFRTEIEPKAAGKWEAKHGLFGISGLSFVPAKPLIPASLYRLKVTHVREVMGGGLPDLNVVVTTEPPALLGGVVPASGVTAVLPDAPITVQLRGPNRGLRQLVVTLDPAVKIGAASSSDDRVFRWTHTALAQGQVYRLVVQDMNQVDPAKRLLYDGRFTVVPEPAVSGTNRDHFYPGDAIDVQFSEGMKPETVKFDWGMAGQGSWTSAATYHFVPTGLVAGRSYVYKVLAGAMSVRGGRLEVDKSFVISPPGTVVVTASSPQGWGVSRSAVVAFSFDQPVDHASAQSHFSLLPGVAGSFGWSGNTMTFRPAGLDFQTTYTVGLAPGVAGLYGLPSARGFGQSFTTELEVVRLNAPYYRQPFALSCEATSLRMALGHYGISASEGDIVARAGYAPRPRDTATNTWDDPYAMFVGDINGVFGVTGWGVYAEPIAGAARSYGRDASAYTGVSVDFIAAQIHAGYPVLAWGTTYPVKPDGWNTTDRGPVSAPRSEHVRLIVGVTGRADAPASFEVYDPFFGQFSWTPEQLSANLNAYLPDSNQIVVVR